MSGKEFLKSNEEALTKLVTKTFVPAENSKITLIRVAINFDTALETKLLVKSLKELKFETEIDETGSSLEENALIKARVIFNTFKKNCFADDSGLEVSALGGKPGVHSRYAGNQKNAQE